MTDPTNRNEAFSLVQRVMLIQLSDDGNLGEAESLLVRALALDPRSIEALQEAAHFYDAVVPNAAKANEYASRCREQLVKIIGEMDEIMATDSRLTPRNGVGPERCGSRESRTVSQPDSIGSVDLRFEHQHDS